MKKIYALLVLFTGLSAAAQTGVIKGKITTTDGKPAADVNVVVEKAGRIAVSLEDGTFALRNIKTGTYVLTVSHEGLQTVSKNVTVTKDSTAELQFILAETAKKLEEVIVEARRTANVKAVTIGKVAIPAMDLPQAITVVGQELIQSQQAQRLSDVLKNVNGVYLATTRGATQENFSARGYSITGNNLFKDGARVNSGTMPEISGLERVEVLKGSAAILFGNVAPGGIVNMVTKQPKFNTGGEVSMRIGSYDLYKPAFDVYGPLSSSVAYRINGTYESARSYRDVVSSKRYYVNPSLLFKLGGRTTLLVQGDYLNHEFTPDFGIGTIDSITIPKVPRSAFFGTSWQYAKTQQSSATAALTHELNNRWKLNASVSYQNYKRDYYSTERIQALANGDWGRPLNRANNIEDYYVAQANLTGKFKTGNMDHMLLAGVDADRYYTTVYSYDQPTLYDSINLLNPNKFVARTDIPAAKEIKVVKTPTNRFGAYIQDLVTVLPKLKVLLGLRWSIQEAKAAATTNLTNNTTTYGAVKTDRAFSPRAGIVYQPTKHTSFFASYANSFTPNTGTDVYGNALSPSIIDQLELGVKNDLFNGMVTANITAYRIVNNNLAQTALFDANGLPNNNTNFKALTGQTKSDGVEVDLSAHPIKGLDITAGYSYNFIRYTKTPDAKGNFIEGERLQNSVASTANATILYNTNGWKFGASVFYTGPRSAGFNNTKFSASQPYFYGRSRLFNIDGFATVDISAGYTYGKVSVLAKVSNLTNTFNYYTHENYSINPIPPTQLVATVAYRF